MSNDRPSLIRRALDAHRDYLEATFARDKAERDAEVKKSIDFAKRKRAEWGVSEPWEYREVSREGDAGHVCVRVARSVDLQFKISNCFVIRICALCGDRHAIEGSGYKKIDDLETLGWALTQETNCPVCGTQYPLDLGGVET